MRNIRVLVTVQVDDADLATMQTAAVEAVKFSLKDVSAGFVDTPQAEYIPVGLVDVVLYNNDWDNG